ncbi:MAG: hypothetical protein Crog4KO_19040 [Crocinitomicaceae bacterium]
MNVNVYLDESGDGGWNFEAPSGSGGSSRYYIYAMLVVPSHLAGKTKNIIKETYRFGRFPFKQEKKGGVLYNKHRKFFCHKVVALLEKEPTIKIRCIILEKENVPDLIKNDSFEILCNHMIHLGITNLIGYAHKVSIFPDEKSISKKRIYAAEDYLKSRSWFDFNNVIPFEYSQKKGNDNFNIIFVDWIANTIWRHFESKKNPAYNILKDHVEVIKLSM